MRTEEKTTKKKIKPKAVGRQGARSKTSRLIEKCVHLKRLLLYRS